MTFFYNVFPSSPGGLFFDLYVILCMQTVPDLSTPHQQAIPKVGKKRSKLGHLNNVGTKRAAALRAHVPSFFPLGLGIDQ